MKSAEMKVGENWKKVDAKDLCREDQRAEFRCCVCKKEAHLAVPIEKIENYFFSNEHTDDCYLADGGKTFITKNGVKYKVDDLLKAKDKPIPKGGEDGGEHGPKHKTGGRLIPKEEPLVDNKTKDAPKEIKSCSSFYNNLKETNIDKYITDNIKVKDILVDYRTIDYYRKNGLEGIKLFIGTRCKAPFILEKKYSSYICVKDAYTKDLQKAIYLLIKCEEPSNDLKFKEKFFEKTTNPEGNEMYKIKYFALFGKVKSANISGYKVYELQKLAKARYTFLDWREICWNE